MNDHRIGRLRSMAEKDLRITHCARTLLFRIYSARVLDPHSLVTDAFDLPWTTIARWCGLHDRMNCYQRSTELVRAGYLYDEGVKGCPPTNTYKLNLKLDLSKLVRDGVVPPTVRRKGNKDASTRKALVAMRAAAR